MKLMTFNVQHCKNYLTGEIDYERFGQVLRDCGADIPAIVASDHRPHVAVIEQEEGVDLC